MKSYLKDFFLEFDYPKDGADCLYAAYSDICEISECDRDFRALTDEYAAGSLPAYKRVKECCKGISEKTGIHPYTLELLYYICISKHLLSLYLEKGLERQIWHDSMLDLKYKLIECHLVKNIWGCFVAEWFGRFFDLTRFALGRLQFELLPFGEYLPKIETEVDGVSLRSDTLTINVHIPRTETPIDKDSCDRAYAMAMSFFKDSINTGDSAAFMCHSWLLYPENDKILHEKSNIRRFMSEYTVLKVEQDNGTYEDMWRLFDMDYTGNFDDYPEDTSARRAYKAHLKNGGKVGIGIGVKVVQYEN